MQLSKSLAVSQHEGGLRTKYAGQQVVNLRCVQIVGVANVRVQVATNYSIGGQIQVAMGSNEKAVQWKRNQVVCELARRRLEDRTRRQTNY